jgi:3-(3-hydroxy-phenyl)propionate hydroxylase
MMIENCWRGGRETTGEGAYEVVVVGGGPTGLMLAAELQIAGVDVVVVERRGDQHVDGSRAGGLLSRSLEVLDQRGVVARFVEAGHTIPAHGFAGIPLDLSDLPTRHNYVLALRQSEFEPILADWVIGDLGVAIIRNREVVDVVQDDTGVEVRLDDGAHLRAAYLVGCDGGRSVTRTVAGLAFTGSDATTSWIVAEVDTESEPEPGMRSDQHGSHGISRIGADGPIRLVLTEPVLRQGEPTIDELRDALVAVFGTDHGLHTVHWMSRFSDATRLAASYRDRRVLLAGDAAHVHPPHGGQGLNTGLQDAVNLGWKLARAVHGDDDDLLDTYHAERRPVAARVLHNTLAQVALTRGGDRHQALRDTMTDLLVMDQPRHHLAAMLTGLDICYDDVRCSGTHPLVGRRIPDLALVTADGPTRITELLHEARPVVLNFAGPGAFDAVGCRHRVAVVDARCDDEWVLPVIGQVAAPPAVLIRPDGHVAWVGHPTDADLDDALTTWCGHHGCLSAEGSRHVR